MTSQCETGRVEATLIPGDGIGLEIVEAVQIVLDALGLPFDWDVQHGGDHDAGRRRIPVGQCVPA